MTTREILKNRIAELKEQEEAASHYGNDRAIRDARTRLNEVESLLDLLNEEHADGAAVKPVADEREQQDLREAEQICSDELNDYAREKGRM